MEDSGSIKSQTKGRMSEREEEEMRNEFKASLQELHKVPSIMEQLQKQKAHQAPEINSKQS